MSSREALVDGRSVREDLERFARWTIEVEHAALPPHLPAGEREAFERYYQGLPVPGDERAIRRHLRVLWRSEAGWSARWLAKRVRSGQRPRVLDAGSGFGTYAMLYAALGAEVTGIDLRPDRLDAAGRRLAWYRDRVGEDLVVSYRRADLTEDWDQDYDLVWVYNAISHIDPLESFLGAVRDHLRPGGVLVVGDLNGARPAHQRRLAELRSDVHQEYVAPDGQRHRYAVERLFTPREMRATMEACGLRVCHHELYWGGMALLPGPVYEGMLRPLQRLWWAGGPAGRRQLVVARSGGDPPPPSAANSAVAIRGRR